MNTTPQTPSDLAQLYRFSVLDFLVDLANQISHDFIGRPQLYTKLEGEGPKVEVEGPKVEALRDVLGSLYVQYGTEPTRLAPKQRNHIFNALFGMPGGNASSGSNSFVFLRDELLEACTRYAANVRSRNEGLLTEEVQTALVPFQQYLTGLQGSPERKSSAGSSVSWSLKQLIAVTDVAYRILRTDQIARVFGVAKAPQERWPLFVADSNGNILVEEVSMRRITRGLFGQLQQVALTGARAIDTILAPDQVLEELISQCNAWSSALTTARKTCCAAGLPYIGRT